MIDLLRHAPDIGGLASLLARLAAGRDGEAWGKVLEKVGEPVWRLALRITGDAALSEDVVQESLLQVRDCSGRFAARSADPDVHAYHWILRIAGTTCIDLVRRQHHQRQRDRRAGARQGAPAMTDQAPGADLERREVAAGLRRAVAALPARFRHAVTLYFFAGHDYATVALQLGIDAGLPPHRAAGRRRDRRRRNPSPEGGHNPGVLGASACHIRGCERIIEGGLRARTSSGCACGGAGSRLECMVQRPVPPPVMTLLLRDSRASARCASGCTPGLGSDVAGVARYRPASQPGTTITLPR